MVSPMYLQRDQKISALLIKELDRQQNTLQMIPSENYASVEVLRVNGSVLSNKYAEGYPHKRYYQGNGVVDEIEEIAIARAKKLFGAEHANVQPYSGSPANMAAYHALLKPGEKILGMKLSMGGHLTHGHKVNFSSRYFTAVQYGVDEKTGLIDLDAVRKMARKEKPRIVVSGATAYPRIINFKEFHKIAVEVGAYSFADISHIAGLIAGKQHQSPLPFTDVVMSTTHKTLRGPRGAILLCRKEDRVVSIPSTLEDKEKIKLKDLAGKIDQAVFPGLQGGPHMQSIAAKAVAFHEALQPEFQRYASQVVRNAKVLASTLMEEGIKIVTEGTDNHLILVDLRALGIGLGRQAAVALEHVGIVANANTVPFDTASPFMPSGLRLGTPALTTRGMRESEMEEIGQGISKIILNSNDKNIQLKVRDCVKELCLRFPIYTELED